MLLQKNSFEMKLWLLFPVDRLGHHQLRPPHLQTLEPKISNNFISKHSHTSCALNKFKYYHLCQQGTGRHAECKMIPLEMNLPNKEKIRIATILLHPADKMNQKPPFKIRCHQFYDMVLCCMQNKFRNAKIVSISAHPIFQLNFPLFCTDRPAISAKFYMSRHYNSCAKDFEEF